MHLRRARQVMTIAMAVLVLASPLLLKKSDEKFALDGVENTAQFPKLSAEKLVDGSAQSEFETYVQQHLPGKPFMVRLRNEITFSALHTVSNINYSMNRDRNLFSWENVSYYLQYFAPISEDGMQELIGKSDRMKTSKET